MKILFMCTANSCRSVLSEALFNHMAPAGFQAVSAGSFPSGQLNLRALATLEKAGVTVHGLYSKGSEVFADSPPDIVITVCDQAAGEPCPVYLGPAIKSHWGLADPSDVQSEQEAIQAAFDTTVEIIKRRFTALFAAKIDRLSPHEQKEVLDEIGGL
ncbi:arsenate reductase ArsC [Pseudomonas sp. CCC3.2]|uniref:arsenate reductase ArsC n=1 Tax=unclassified Pseudomonas TaxID=196821 RepID=UPI002AB3A59E|nr:MULTISPECIES: arsenate reductase ArsC [unclassified Pseudomonas]MDY7560992.1 arsenate reductase ArsC [Pseudomonas sp. AB6]MEA9977111.1 arsenate reductase ArsC [Pseudomonas sp. RTS4]MEB0180390.1 arsenate reductase ArsC [Pseudomonas sp. CCC3.2]MEB0197723.1 arsenate reductase ArsC [Pseudomonas sp. 5S4]MEB0210158.1 arsenate reductase ArsC [Pseudomonas sp. AB6]